MRYLSLAHGTSIAWLHERTTSDYVNLRKIDTDKQAADILTKPFESPLKWEPLVEMINIFDHTTYWKQPTFSPTAVVRFLGNFDQVRLTRTAVPLLEFGSVQVTAVCECLMSLGRFDHCPILKNLDMRSKSSCEEPGSRFRGGCVGPELFFPP